MVFMAVTLLLSLLLPAFLFLFWRKRHNLKLGPALVGAAAFFVFALVLEQALHLIVLKPGADGSVALAQDSPLLFVLYGVFAAGVFEETARLISFILLKRRYGGVGAALSYGIGHGGIEAIGLVGLSMISNLALCLVINSGNTAALGPLPQVAEAVDTLVNTEPVLFLAGGIERIAAMAVHISLSVLVWLAVSKRKLWLFPAAIVLHALVDLPAMLSKIGVINSIAAVEVIVFVLAAALVAAAVRITRYAKN
jgi:uncharacterized membrane protein YhfC